MSESMGYRLSGCPSLYATLIAFDHYWLKAPQSG